MTTSTKTKPARAPAPTTPPREPTEAEIRHAAHQLWLEEGRPEGRELDHWFAARERLLHHHGRSAGRGKKAAAAPVHFPPADLPATPASPTVHP
jgi:hypothetical protein